ncbi:hypothetical protein CN97_00750 [Haematobacter massiliensis]|uniref:HK97 gp10 family phage protein n=1 Tax=Haematobacter massiliensis TaxID=195105 RepID=A0A086Y0D9_9RHOB|nr:hypothetical protein [Haematobacter massiliensis]KFI27739.1 hypothetical protein CN97_00750 [Haematobacter massiliensis]OWJ82712.1 hypothetical protein CDV51_17035 [Haematobacter massiliensis]
MGIEDDINRRIAVYEKRLEAVLKSSVQDVFREMTTPVSNGGRLPVDTGFLRASAQASLEDFPSADKANPDKSKRYAFSMGSVSAVIMGANLRDEIFLGFTANYAAYKEAKHGFVESAVLQFPAFVNKNAAKAMKAFP